MIRDDFSEEGIPNIRIWRAYGNATCRAGKLLLPSADDYVVSVDAVKLDEGAEIKVAFDSGEGSIEITSYETIQPPSQVGIVYDAVEPRTAGPALYLIRNGGTIAYTSTYYPVVVTINSTEEKIKVYYEGHDAWGRPVPKTLLAEMKSQFWQKDVYIILAGGSLAVDNITATSGYESLPAQMYIVVNSVIAIIPLLLLMPLLRTIRTIRKTLLKS